MQFGEGHSHVHREARSGWTTPEVHLVHKKKKKKEERKGRREETQLYLSPALIYSPQGRGRGKLGFFYASKGSRSIKKILGCAERNKSTLHASFFSHFLVILPPCLAHPLLGHLDPQSPRVPTSQTVVTWDISLVKTPGQKRQA